MKILLLLFSGILIFQISNAAVPLLPVKNINAREIMVPIGNNTEISLLDFSVIKVKDYEKVTGKKMNWLERIAFKIFQKKIGKNIGKDKTFNSKKSKTLSGNNNAFKFNSRGFKLGLFGGIYGLIATFFIKGGSRAENINRIIWTFIGFLGFILIVFLIFYLLFYFGVLQLNF